MKPSLISVERIVASILLIRGEKVILDRDLAQLYGVETRVLNQAVRRNLNRFPKDFIFSLTREEILGISQSVTSLVVSQEGGSVLISRHGVLSVLRVSVVNWFSALLSPRRHGEH